MNAFRFALLLSFALSVNSADPAAAGGLGSKIDKLFSKKTKSRGAQKAETSQKTAKAESPAPTCNAVSSMGLCYSFAGKKNAEEKPRKGNEMACKFMKGRFLASDSCPAAKALGKCTIKAGEPEEYSLFYYQGGRLNRSSAEKDCKNPKSGIHAQGAGKWMAF